MSRPTPSRDWFERLTRDDLDLLRRVGPAAGVEPDAVGQDPAALLAVLAHPAAYDAVLVDDEAGLVPTSPFLAFALVVHRGWVELREARAVEEWVGPRQWIPVLGGDDLRELLDDPARRLFLAELLVSYTRVASGSTWVQTARGRRRRRFSELDPVRLAALLDVVPASEHAGVYRRLGDLALFLTGVFPDHTALHGLGRHDRGRLLRLSGLGLEPDDEPRLGTGAPTGTVGVLEQLGVRWYALAARTARGPLVHTASVLAEVSARFGAARRTLNYLTHRHLFPLRTSWFPEPPS